MDEVCGSKRRQMHKLQKQINKEVKETRAEYLSKLMANLKVGQEDLKEMDKLPYKVEERLI